VTRALHTALAVSVGVLVGAGLTFVVGVLADRDPAAASAPAPANVAKGKSTDHRLLDEVVARVRREYVEAVPDAAMEQAAVEGVVSSLDPHSAFLTAAEYDEMRVNTAGSYSGVGIEVSAQEGKVVVVSPIEGSPAARAGVHAGDVILAVDDQPVYPQKLNETIDRMRGSVGSHVRLAVRRGGEPEPLKFDLERSEVHVHTVRAEPMRGGYGYVRITQFSDSTPADLDQALAELTVATAKPLRGLVLDLRGNPGGVLESAVGVADEFLDSGVIVRADGRTPDARFEMDATAGDVLDGAPLVVLVDGGSASGSEIVAGALRDHRRATLMGERTFGKGSVQTVIPLRDGQALKLTTSKYFTPSGASIHEKGIEPDGDDDEGFRRAGRAAVPARSQPRLAARAGLRTLTRLRPDQASSCIPALISTPISIAAIGRKLSPNPALRFAGSATYDLK
jgi:carboxyl-terminal processing protease